jgi:hypothetical protein
LQAGGDRGVSDSDGELVGIELFADPLGLFGSFGMRRISQNVEQVLINLIGLQQELCVAVRHRRTSRQLIVRIPHRRRDSLAAARRSTPEWAEAAGCRVPASR